jgi:hypothetical protein
MVMRKKRWQQRHITESFMKFAMRVSLVVVAGSLGLILMTVIMRGLPALNWDMVSQVPKGGFYMGKEGGCSTPSSACFTLRREPCWQWSSACRWPYLKAYERSQMGRYVRLAWDVLWASPPSCTGPSALP